MNHQVNVRQGSGYDTQHAGFDLLFAPDPRYMAVDLQTGPDGAVYLIDWCDLQHCHNPAPEKWDRTNGRIYRVSWAESYRPVKVALGAKSDLELAQLHTHKNDWYSRQARGLLQQRATTRAIDAKAVALLREQALGSDVPLVLRAVWTLHVIGALQAGHLTGSVSKHSDDVVQAWAVHLATEKAGESLIDGWTLMGLANDPSPIVRLAVASALSILSAPQVWEVASALAAHGEDEFRLNGGKIFFVGCDGAKHVGRLVLTGTSAKLAEDSTEVKGKSPSHVLAETKIDLKQGDWQRLRVEYAGDQMAARLNGQEMKVQHEYLATPKVRWWFAAGGDNVQLRNVRFSEGQPLETAK